MPSKNILEFRPKATSMQIIRKDLNSIGIKLDLSKTNKTWIKLKELTQGWRQDLRDVGLGSATGGGLYKRIEGIFQRKRTQFSVKNSPPCVKVFPEGGLTPHPAPLWRHP